MPDPAAKRLFWYVFAGSRGGSTRMKIIMLLKERPYNTQRLAQALNLHYKSIQHNLDVLSKNNLVVKQGDTYAVMFFISPYLEAKMGSFEQICNQIEKGKHLR